MDNIYFYFFVYSLIFESACVCFLFARLANRINDQMTSDQLIFCNHSSIYYAEG